MSEHGEGPKRPPTPRSRSAGTRLEAPAERLHTRDRQGAGPAPAAADRPGGADPQPGPAGRPATRHGTPILLVRHVLPAVVVLAGLVAMTFGSDTALEGGAGLVSAGLAIWLLNWLFRIGAQGDAERDAEDRAREYFDQHGRWPEGR